MGAILYSTPISMIFGDDVCSYIRVYNTDFQALRSLFDGFLAKNAIFEHLGCTGAILYKHPISTILSDNIGF